MIIQLKLIILKTKKLVSICIYVFSGLNYDNGLHLQNDV